MKENTSTINLREVVYTSESQLRKPGRLLRNMIQDLVASRELAWRLFVRDVSAQYRQTALGYFWAIFPPLLTGVIFILLNSANVLRIEKIEVPYPVYVIIGTISYSLFVDALNAPLKVVNASRAILIKINFPREALLLAALGHVLLSLAIKLVLIVAIFAIFKVSIQQTALLVPIPLAGLMLAGMMMGIMLVPLEALFKDITHGLVVVTTGLMFITPVAYPPPKEGLLSTIVAYNPLTPLIMSVRESILIGQSDYTGSMLTILLLTVVLTFIGWVLFRLALPIIIERLGS